MLIKHCMLLISIGIGIGPIHSRSEITNTIVCYEQCRIEANSESWERIYVFQFNKAMFDHPMNLGHTDGRIFLVLFAD